MRISMTSLLLAMLPVSFPAQGQKAKNATSDLERRVDAYVQPYVESGNFSGVILIARGDQKLLEKGYGFANREWKIANAPDTRFHIASVSKTFTSAATMLLQERGKLSVKDPLNKWIPDYPRGNVITLHHLLTHTSGIPNVNNFPDYDEKSRSAHSLTEIISWFKDKPLEFKPGAKYSYSNSNYNLLAYVIEKASGQSYGEFLEANIFKPLGLRATGHDGYPGLLIPKRAAGYSPADATDAENAPFLDWSTKTGNGSLYSTADDLYRWARAMTTDALVNAASRKQIFTNHIDGTGYGWFIRDKAQRFSIAMNGRSPGFASNLERFPESGLYVVTLSNLYSSLTQAMATDVGAIAHGEERKPQVATGTVNVPAKLLDEYAGDYEFGEDYRFSPVKQIAIVRRGEWLAANPGGGGDLSYLLPRGENDFIDRAYGGKVTFERDGSGKVVAFVWDFGFAKFRAVRK
jgi:CubicO group peptidase (beta-lactamase class C family)